MLHATKATKFAILTTVRRAAVKQASLAHF
jgi:hypothetical protein